MQKRRTNLGCSRLTRSVHLLLLAAPILAWGQTLQVHPVHRAEGQGTDASFVQASSQFFLDESKAVQEAPDSCRIHQVKTFPGSREFGSDFLEAMTGDPGVRNSNVVWGLTADLSSKVQEQDRAMYISKSIDGGKTWAEVARLGPEYFDADIGEGERNGLAVAPGGSEFVITTQRGAFQVVPQRRSFDATAKPMVRSIAGPRVTQLDPFVMIPKKIGDPVTANVVRITADGKHLLLGYGYFDLNPQLLPYRKASDGSWIRDGSLPPLPTRLDLLSMQFEDARGAGPLALYLGTGDQAFRLKSHAGRWTRIRGVGPDSAIQEINTVGGPHLAACWGVYNPVSADAVERVTRATFLLHRDSDEAGSNIRAFGVEVDPVRPNREVVTSLTGVYVSKDFGKSWIRLNDLPDGEFRTAHFNPESGTIIVSGIEGTFLVNPFSPTCSAHLRIRGH